MERRARGGRERASESEALSLAKKEGKKGREEEEQQLFFSFSRSAREYAATKRENDFDFPDDDEGRVGRENEDDDVCALSPLVLPVFNHHRSSDSTV